MSIADKLIQITENLQKIHDKAYRDGFKSAAEEIGYSWMECYNCHNLFIDQGYPECPHCGTLNDGSEGDYEYDCPNCGEHFYEEGPPICPNCGTDYNSWWDEPPPEDNSEYIYCPQCGHANPQGISYCEECSWGIAPVEWNCPQCGYCWEEVDSMGPMFCPECDWNVLDSYSPEDN